MCRAEDRMRLQIQPGNFLDRQIRVECPHRNKVPEMSALFGHVPAGLQTSTNPEPHPDRRLTLDGIEPWPQTCQTTPTCVFAPASAEEVAGGLAILRKTDQTFAVRTQGHMPIPGAADISNGVLMVTTSLNSVQYADDSKSVVQIGAGNRWLDAYEAGVSGLLLGGGISYFNSDHGWGVDSVVNYEVVLANGTVYEANAQQNSDLYWALKGGAFNFGIVTRFDLTTFSVPYMWGARGEGSAYYDASALDPLVNAYASYAVASGGSSDPVQRDHWGGIGDGIYMHRGDDPAPAALKNFTDIPYTFQDFRVGKTILAWRMTRIP
ncbi:hypothetical protein VN97_g8714 [Penicillium thymicola]|uniref:FAD-binding PCMH-type domain-containing protein n=1 Tax=Penicillium thymicola TaxID=293382 RepID=A0AAI9TCS3_PENTH|nr:hypothetical protein VN97_g8714 [Penicillium thymicola]